MGLGISHLHLCEVLHVYCLLALEDSGDLVYDQVVMEVSIFCFEVEDIRPTILTRHVPHPLAVRECYQVWALAWRLPAGGCDSFENSVYTT